MNTVLEVRGLLASLVSVAMCRTYDGFEEETVPPVIARFFYSYEIAILLSRGIELAAVLIKWNDLG